MVHVNATIWNSGDPNWGIDPTKTTIWLRSATSSLIFAPPSGGHEEWIVFECVQTVTRSRDPLRSHLHWKRNSAVHQPEQREKTGQLGNSFSIFSTKKMIKVQKKETSLKKTWWEKKGSAMFYCDSSPANNKERCLWPNASHKHPPSQMGCKGKSPYQLGNCQPISFGRSHLNINSRWLR